MKLSRGTPAQGHRAGRLRRGERGQVVVAGTLLLAALIGIVGLVVDYGFAASQRRQAQSAADAGALAAARILFEGGSAGQARAAAEEYVAANGFAEVDGATVSVNLPPTSGEYAGNPFYAEVIIDDDTTTFFIHAFYPGDLSISARGVAGMSDFPAPYAIVALNPTACDAYEQTGQASVAVAGGGIMVNSSCASSAFTKTGSGTIAVEGSIDVHGGASVTGSGPVSPPPDDEVLWTVDDPLAGMPAPALGPAAPGSPGTASSPQTWVISGGTNVTLQPGTYYGGLDIRCSGCTVTFEPGIYVMAGGGFTKSGNPNITGDGVMVYVTDCNGPADTSACSGDGVARPVNLSGAGTLGLSPPTSEPYEGVTFWQDRLITDDMVIAGDNSLVQGIFYAPGARLVLTGGAELGTIQIVADRVAVSGNAPIDLTYGDFRTFEAPDVVLVE